MKLTAAAGLVLSFVVLVALLTTKKPPQNDQTVVKQVKFEKANVSLSIDNTWEPLSLGPLTQQQTNSLCLPVLVYHDTNSVHVIKVFCTSSRQSPQVVGGVLMSNAAANKGTVKNSVQMLSGFSTQTGIPVVHVSYETSTSHFFSGDVMRAHVYLFQNNDKYCVILNYIAKKDCESSVADQMIRNTLAGN